MMGSRNNSASMAGHNLGVGLFPPHLADMTSDQGGSLISQEDLEAMFAFESIDDSLDFPIYPNHGDLDQLGGDMSGLAMSPNNPLMSYPLVDDGNLSLDSLEEYSTGNAHVHAAPWNPAIPRSDAGMYSGSLQIPSVKHEADLSNMPHSFGGFSYDSGYASNYGPTLAPAPQTVETESIFSDLSSAPGMFHMDAASDVAEPPAKRAKKQFICHMAGDHKTREFANIHDLERHQKSRHNIMPTHSASEFFKCAYPGCRNASKLWDRKDNFRNHLQRKHFEMRTDDRTRARIDEVVQKSCRKLSAQQMIMNSAQKENEKRKSKALIQQRKAKKLLKSGTAPVVHQNASVSGRNTLERKISTSSGEEQILLSPSITQDPYNITSAPAISLSPVDQNQIMPVWENFQMGEMSSGMSTPNAANDFW